MDSFDRVAKAFDQLGPNLMEQLFIYPWVKLFERVPKESQRPYIKVPLMDAKTVREPKRLVMIFWAPNSGAVRNGTRPHSHGGSPARVRVLYGTLRQEVFSMDSDEAGRRQINSTETCYTACDPRRSDGEFVEKPQIIHAVSNAAASVEGWSDGWSVSLHEFDYEFLMEVYDFDKNLKWPVRGDEDTLGDPPANAVPIWG